jgi:hypothetical protein
MMVKSFCFSLEIWRGLAAWIGFSGISWRGAEGAEGAELAEGAEGEVGEKRTVYILDIWVL